MRTLLLAVCGLVGLIVPVAHAALGTLAAHVLGWLADQGLIALVVIVPLVAMMAWGDSAPVES